MLLLNVIMTFIIYNWSYTEGLPKVILPSLGNITGHYLISSSGGTKYKAFEGVPYAMPPVGEKRFEPPQPVEPWSGELIANKMPEACLSAHGNEQGSYLYGVEDCLYLNFYVPVKRTTRLLPVIIYLYGGSWSFSPMKGREEEYLMDNGGAIFVVPNYRHGVLGFLSTEDEVVPGNMGMKDQVAAMQWVSKYIKYFGGDPKKVAIMGNSAGGSNVQFMYLSPMAAGLFHSGLSMSGVALTFAEMNKHPRNRAVELSKLVNCPTASNSEMVRCLKTKSAHDLFNAQTKFMDWDLNEVGPFAPVVEKKSKQPFLDRPPIDILKSGKVNDAPWVASTVSEEGALFLTAYLKNETALEELLFKNWESIAPRLLQYHNSIPISQHNNISRIIRDHYFPNIKKISKKTIFTLIQVLSDKLFHTPAVKMAKLQAKVTRSPVYYYYYSYRAEGGSVTSEITHNNDDFGVCHADDLQLVFKNNMYSQKDSARDLKMQTEMIKFWVSLADTGRPNFGYRWQKVDPNRSGLNYLHIAAPGNSQMEYLEDFYQYSFWDSLKIYND